VHVTPVVLVLVLCNIVLHLLVPPVVHFLSFVHIVSVRGFDAVVLITRLYYTCHCKLLQEL
jgi:hypothetical protein